LRRQGFVEQQNLVVDEQGYGLRADRFPEHAAELARAFRLSSRGAWAAPKPHSLWTRAGRGSLDDLVGALLKIQGHIEAKRPGGLKVDSH
jgi:hypothetical protein